MYECPNCNANLKFDIKTQMLLCDRCDTKMDPYAFQKEQDAEEQTMQEDDYEITVFTCPQCGGRLVSDDTTAATFCSYCGSSTILQSRVSNLRRPRYIIPFQKTKEDCRDIYRKMMKHAWYAPGQMREEAYISRMRSIYMPYWVYTAAKYGRARQSASQYVRNVNYDVTMYSWLQAHVKAECKWLAFDASSSFSDRLSNAIAPFVWLDIKRFTPSYLSGFYADVDDVPPELYESDVSDIMQYELYKRFAKEPFFEKYTLGDMSDDLRPNEIYKELAMFPVWFLTYRDKDRVSYVVINGQTGKAAGDIPVDVNRYFMGSVLLALPLFGLLSLVGNLQPAVMLVAAGVMAGVCALFSVRQQKWLRAKEDYMDDKGSGRYLDIGMRRERKPGKFAIPAVPLKVGDVLAVTWKPAIGILAAILIMVCQPALAFYYYAAAAAILMLMGWDVMEIIGRHNLLASRPLPQFDRRGGEEDGR